MTSRQLPTTTQAIILQASSSNRKPVYNDTQVVNKPLPALKPGELLVRINAAAFNHRDLWIRKGLYPRILMGSVLGSDGAGLVIGAGNPEDPLLNRRVFLTPMRGWIKHPKAPEAEFGILGGGSHPPLGTFTEYMVVERDEVIPSPEHLDDIHVAAWPLGGLTAWRAVIVNAEVKAGQNVLVTGVGGGVAILAVQICLAKGANVYVTSGSPDKIKKAISLGASGGANYKDKNWPGDIAALLAKSESGSKELDAVVDSAGGEIMTQVGQILKPGGRIVIYGMTSQPKVTFTMREVLKNQRLIGSTMGSRQDLIDATNFLGQHQIVPVVSHVLDGFEAAEQGFELMKRGDQFGKIVIRVQNPATRVKL
ncbi:NAD(P)-binding protein [Pluteus cervinus]|uniref:NAD(P)-binding protein n=1 Tax=Pluteus cervinus TaxID=181527 RepID=A0ACD3AMF7_9AGAR|nr:NAD(P)-binding protein [Pluteus cervinus]